MAIYDKDLVIAFRKRIVDYIKKNHTLADFDAMTFGDVLDQLQAGKDDKTAKAVKPTPGMQEFSDLHPELPADAKARNFLKFRRMYVDKDLQIDDKKQSPEELARKGSKQCDFVRHVFKIQKLVHFYDQGLYNDFLRKTEFKITRAVDKSRLKEHIEAIGAMAARPVLEVIEYAAANGLCQLDDRYNAFREDNSTRARALGLASGVYASLSALVSTTPTTPPKAG